VSLSSKYLFVQRILLGASIGLYVVCLVLDTFPGTPGWVVLLMGWLQLAASGRGPFVSLAWVANPLLFFAWACRNTPAPTVVRIAACIALWLSVAYGTLGHDVSLFTEGPVPNATVVISPGYSFWVGSIAVAVCRSSSMRRPRLSHSGSSRVRVTRIS
jgi:uncharacterized membrane protein